MVNAWNSIVSSFRKLWASHGKTIFRIGVLLTLVIGIYRLSVAFSCLLFESGGSSAMDLKFRSIEVDRWFSGMPIYGVLQHSTYPPATYVILWPLIGWFDYHGWHDITSQRIMWAITTVPMLLLLVYLCVRESKANTNLEKIFIASMTFSLYPSGLTIYMGQLINHFLPLLLAGLLLLNNSKGRLQYDILAGSLLAFALAKPSTSVPFYWIVLFLPGRVRPFIIVLVGYVLVTFFSASFQESSLVTLLTDWIRSAPNVNMAQGHANIHKWLVALNLKQLSLPSSFLILGILGIWIFLYRKSNFWILVGVSAIVAHFWTYHRAYDDLLILLPMITLFRITKQGPTTDGIDVIAAILLISSWAVLLFVPARIIVNQTMLSMVVEIIQTVIWFSMLVFLIFYAWREKKNDPVPNINGMLINVSS